MKRIAIIGGGAAGLAAAVSAAQANAAQSSDQASTAPVRPAHITLFEKADRVGSSILASGNGRCNFSNHNIQASLYHNAAFVEESFTALPPQEVLAFFASLGLMWAEESEGRLYPLSNKATSVLDILRFAARDAGVEIKCGAEVCAVTPAKGRFLVSLEDDTASFFDVVIIACGGKVARSLLPATYHYHNTQPLLGPIKTTTEPLRGLNNIRVRCRVSIKNQVEVGEVLFRDYGLSGIAIFNLSRFTEKGDCVSLDFLPQLSLEEVRDALTIRASRFPQRSAVDLLAGVIQQPLARAVLRAANLAAEASLAVEDTAALAKALKTFSVMAEGIGDFRQCQVQRGCFDVVDFSSTTLESKHDPGLFVVGEALDVDGPCGGFNLHWAWTSGILAAQHAIT